MSRRKRPGHLFPNAADDRRHAYSDTEQTVSEQESSSAYRLAYDDIDFLLRDEMRPVRFLLELSKPELVLQEHGVNHSVVIFGSARTTSMENALLQKQEIEHALSDRPDDSDLLAGLAKADAGLRHAGYYEQARKLAGLISDKSGCEDCPQLHVITGGGPGVMEAANRGAAEAGGDNIGLNINLPFEQKENPYITPELTFQFHYFFMRKFWFVSLAKAIIVFPGGFGTMDELFDVLTLNQTGKLSQKISIVLFGTDYWNSVLNLGAMVDAGTISPADLDHFHQTDDIDDAFDYVTCDLSDNAMDCPGIIL